MATKAQLAQARIDANAQRARRTKAAAHAQAAQPQAAHVNVEDMFNDIKLPSATRVVVGAILGLATAGVLGYGIGLVMAYALAGVATLTGSVALAFMLSATIWVLGIYASWKICGWAAGKVFASVVLPEGLASRCYESVAGAITGVKDAAADTWNEAKVVQRTKAFTGAYAA